MSKKCKGCGITLQNTNKDVDGYVDNDNLDNVDLCTRCFRMINYGDYKISNKSSDDFITIIKNINNTNSLVLYLVDLFTINDNINMINKYLNNKIILVMTKRDILPKSFKDEKLKKYVKDINTNKNIIDTIIISSKKDYNLDNLINMIKKYNIDGKVYLVGATNSGKSTLVNRLLKNYSNNCSYVTSSIMPSTTLDTLEIKLNDEITLIDTPGLIDKGSIINFIDPKTIKRITPKNEIKPKTFQLNSGKSILMDEIVRLDYVSGDKNSFTVFVSNSVDVVQMNIDTRKEKYINYKYYDFDIDNNSDIVINGFGYIKIVNACKVRLYINNDTNVYVRKSMI